MTDISTSAIAAVADRGGVLDPTAELREPEYRAIAELMPQLVWAALPDGGHDYYNGRVFEQANPLSLKLIGRTEAVGRPLREVIPELAPGLLATVDGARRTGERFVAAEYRIPLRAGA